MFKGDTVALVESRRAIRAAIEENRNLQGEGEVAEAVRGFEEVRELLSEHIVQGRLNERDNYEVAMKEGSGDMDVFEPLPVSAVKLGQNEGDEK